MAAGRAIPAPPATLLPLEHKAARATHWLLYALLILIPLSGWGNASSLADPAAFGRTMLWIFGTNGFDSVVPRIVPPLPSDSDQLLNFVLFARSHHWLLIVGAVLLALHVVAAAPSLAAERCHAALDADRRCYPLIDHRQQIRRRPSAIDHACRYSLWGKVMADGQVTRRDGLKLAAAGLGMAALPTAARAAAPPFVTKIDFKDAKWNRDTYARLDGDVDPTKEKLGWLKGMAWGVRDNEKVRPLFGVEGFSLVRVKRLDDGSWRRMLREIVFYRDLDTGEILKTWHNPYTNEDVRVVPIANDPFNFTLSEFVPDAPDYGGLQKTAPAPKKPFLLNWTTGPDDTLICQTGIDMIYPNALQPDKWPRESAGLMNRVSEHFIYTAKRADIENPRLTHIPHVGSWSRVTPWLPWMLMGQAPGGIDYLCTFGTLPNVAALPADLAAAARAMDEKWLHAPTSDYGPSLSSLENYAREQKPAPVPVGWSPPQPPAAPRPFPAKN